MDYTVGTVWAIYAIVLVVTFIIVLIIMYACGGVSYSVALLIAAIVAAIAAFVSVAWLDQNLLTDSDKTWLGVLFIIAVALPILIILFMIWAACRTPTPCAKPCEKPCEKPVAKPCEKPCDKPQEAATVEQLVQCDKKTGTCEVLEKTVKFGNETTTFVYT